MKVLDLDDDLKERMHDRLIGSCTLPESASWFQRAKSNIKGFRIGFAYAIERICEQHYSLAHSRMMRETIIKMPFLGFLGFVALLSVVYVTSAICGFLEAAGRSLLGRK